MAIQAVSSQLNNMITPHLVQLCVHGHFYQPPREDPFVGTIPIEFGAEPFQNFNEKINAECYQPNALAGNFERISFNFGPTLAAWLEGYDPATYERIIASDRANFERFGYGNALAQVYNHAIAPLGRPQDTRLQIEWGIADFEQRFRHRPDGMWLAETGCNTQVLQMLAEAGIKFTILAPWQADTATIQTLDPTDRAQLQTKLKAARQSRAEADVVHFQAILRQHDQLNAHDQLRYAEALKLFYKPSATSVAEPYRTSEPYLVELANGHSITVFFYNGHLSSSISFDTQATTNADNFAQHWLLPCVENDKLRQRQPQLLLIATDGELYGHHQPQRELFLQYLTRVSAKHVGMEVTFLRHYLEQNPPQRCIQIVDDTSWSCHHGVKRWSTGCECTWGNASWKKHLRGAFDTLASAADVIFEHEGTRLFRDNQAALCDFIHVWAGRENEAEFLARHLKARYRETRHAVSPLALRLLRSQMYKHQMYTSCAFYFEDIDRIEPKNALAAAAITLRLLGRLASSGLRQQFRDELAQAHSQRPSHLTGLQLFLRGERQAGRITVQNRVAAENSEPINSDKIDA